MVQSQNRQITILDATHFLGSCEIVARRLTFAVAGFVGILYPVYLEILVQIVIKFPASRRDSVRGCDEDHSPCCVCGFAVDNEELYVELEYESGGVRMVPARDLYTEALFEAFCKLVGKI